MLKRYAALVALAVTVLSAAAPRAQKAAPASKVTAPKDQFGFAIGDDYRLVNYTQYTDYLKKLQAQSERMVVTDIGKTEEGRTEFMAIITSPENQRKLPLIKAANRRLALAEGLTDEQARALAREGKTVVWIDGGLHATEVLGAQQLIETIYQLTSRSRPRDAAHPQRRCHPLHAVNPDGMDLVSDWYMREADEKRRSTGGIPRLYQKYIGHDDNRDFYMMNHVGERERQPHAVSRVVPADHVQPPPDRTGRHGPVRAAVPRPVQLQLRPADSAGHRHGRRGHPHTAGGRGEAGRRDAQRRAVLDLVQRRHPHDVVLPQPDRHAHRDASATRRRSRSRSCSTCSCRGRTCPIPIPPQDVGISGQSIDYSITVNHAILDLASKRHEDFLYNIYMMGKNAIERGSRDNWTIHPKRIEAARQAIEAAQAGGSRSADNIGPRGGRGGGPGRGGAPVAIYNDVLHDPKMRDPRGYIMPADQADFLTATKFVNALIKAGVVVQRATATFAVAGKPYPAGSYVVKTAQAFRPHVMDMFEPQDHPDDIPVPGRRRRVRRTTSPATTLAYSDGVQFDRILDAFDGPFEKIPDASRRCRRAGSRRRRPAAATS